jgi:ABC-2 type transport system permease protein
MTDSLTEHASGGMFSATPTEHDEASSGVGAGRGVHQLGYRTWSGRLESGWTRWLVISEAGIRRAWQSQWLKRTLFFAWVPAFWFALGFFFWEQAAQYEEWQPIVSQFLRGLPPDPVFDEVKESFQTGDLSSSRHTVWAWLLQTFFRYSQAVLMVLLIGLIAPPLISQDIRSRAFLLYFSRPLNRTEYLLGKLGSLWAFLALISAVPAIALYLIGVVLSPSLDVVWATWDLPIRIIGATVVLVLPTSALALCLSSMTQESRYAGFAWFAIWILGWFTYLSAQTAETIRAAQQTGVEAAQAQAEFPGMGPPRRGRGPFRQRRAAVVPQSAWTNLSLYHTSGKVQSWVFGFAQLKDVYLSMIILSGLTIVSFAVLYYRISAPMRV